MRLRFAGAGASLLMVASRKGSKGGLQAPFGLGVVMLLLLPSEVAYEHLAELGARPPVVDRSQKTAFASAAGTIHAVRFASAQPVGGSIPPPTGHTLAAADPTSADIVGSMRERFLDGDAFRPQTYYAGPVFDRSRKGDYGVPGGDRRVAAKGDRLKPRSPGDTPELDERSSQAPTIAQQDPQSGQPAAPATDVAPAAEQTAPVQQQPAQEPGRSVLAGAPPVLAPPRAGQEDAPASAPVEPGRDAGAQPGLAFAAPDPDPSLRAGRVYFGTAPMGQKLDAIEPWRPGEAPRFEDSDIAASDSANAKLAALPPQVWPLDEGAAIVDTPVERADLPPLLSDPGVVTKDAYRGGHTVVRKGEVTGEDQHPMGPAERLGLDDESREQAEKCLTEVIYFEARGEAVRGQMAVAQVVLNRVFSGKYPNTVCGVVYQNAHRHLACQFTFACDGRPDVVREPDMWERAKTIAAEMLDGKLWLPEVGKATHYHAYWVRPGWVREMTKMHKLGVHTFYRPRKWGDGEDAPEWGDPESTQESARKLVEAAKKL
jgi:spore germination cell wall hydrolase CwlJ-like protein